MATAQVMKQATELLNFYTKEYKARTGALPLLNKAKEKWAARDLIESFGFEDCKSALEWYFKVNKHPEWKSFVYSAEQCILESRSVKADIEKRRKFRVVANEWRNK